MTPAQLADRKRARTEHSAGRSRIARVTLPHPLGVITCGVVVVGGTAYCFPGGSILAVDPAAVQWLEGA